MNKPGSRIKITVACPSGHRLRGGTNLVGKRIKCPKCKSEFVFAPTQPASARNRAVTDTGVMRILGDAPQSRPPATKPAKSESHAITDTGVMRILGNESPSPPAQQLSVEMRRCPRCQVQTPESAAVCEHCNCYLGAMPTFLKQMQGTNDVESN
jgi:hypothetical protein